jgi:tRNA-Thr(GGU) m(6)t(6)A37 methyltransferase TsaA
VFSPYNRPEAFKGLEGFSHIWVSFVFHHCLGKARRLSVRPPRLGGNRKIGVFASRSSHRPNPVGISVIELAGQEQVAGGVSLILKGLDLIDGTPVLDIKPYIPYADAVPDARADFAQQAPQAGFEVCFSAQAELRCEQYAALWPGLRQLIAAILSYDPRPAYLSGTSGDKIFAVRLFQFEVRWRVSASNVIEVFAIEPDIA